MSTKPQKGLLSAVETRDQIQRAAKLEEGNQKSRRGQLYYDRATDRKQLGDSILARKGQLREGGGDGLEE